ncbi:hypothetical protein GY45DRAFT_561205 [Cubamyces sp. BRFM 1775]|nr:hypothetical protein GY45DRAFT_561205 [Cubamyces sp. BRFM 1775]
MEPFPQGRRLRRLIGDIPPGRQVLKTYAKLPRKHCSALSQLRSGHVALNAFLARIRAVTSPLCPVCQVPESVDHFIRTCRRFTIQRHELRRAMGRFPLTLRHALGNIKCRGALLQYVDATNRLSRGPS